MDARIARTRASLQDALLQLARERNLDEITVADIADRAGVNRSSFYQHYSDKDMLLADALDTAIEEAGARLVTLTWPALDPPDELLLHLAHIEQNATLYLRALGDHGSALVTARVRDRLTRVVMAGLRNAGVSPDYADVPLEVVAAGITGSAMGVVRAWLEREPRPSVETAAGWLWKVLLGPRGAWTSAGRAPAEATSTARTASHAVESAVWERAEPTDR